MEAIKECNLAPVLLPSTVAPDGTRFFNRELFSLYSGMFMRAGFPVIVTGELTGMGLHAICAVGFRDGAQAQIQPSNVALQDSSITHLYAHDDNIGPNVRLRIESGPNGEAVLVRDPPTPLYPALTSPSRSHVYPNLRPHNMIVAVPEQLRTSPVALLKESLKNSEAVAQVLSIIGGQQGVTVGVRFANVSEYLGPILAQTLGSGSALSSVRRSFAETVAPLSLHVGIVRIASGASPLLDLVYDTSDNDRHLKPVAHVVFDSSLSPVFQAISDVLHLGTLVDAWA